MTGTPGQDSEERPQFSLRGEATAELRGECPRRVLNVLDAVSLARDKTRTALVNEILGAWADKVLHEASLVAKLTQRNPTEPESAGVRP